MTFLHFSGDMQTYDFFLHFSDDMQTYDFSS